MKTFMLVVAIILAVIFVIRLSIGIARVRNELSGANPQSKQKKQRKKTKDIELSQDQYKVD